MDTTDRWPITDGYDGLVAFYRWIRRICGLLQMDLTNTALFEWDSTKTAFFEWDFDKYGLF